jgi:hypothetical protein
MGGLLEQVPHRKPTEIKSAETSSHKIRKNVEIFGYDVTQ